MNQILNSEPNVVNNSNKNTKTKTEKIEKDVFQKNDNIFYDQNQNTQKVSSDKLIRIFAIFMIVFAVGLISTGVYSFVSNQQVIQDLPVDTTPSAIITAEEVDGKVKITASDKTNINQLVYSWNAQKENKVQGEGKTIEKIIDLPAGSNNLVISVKNDDGVETSYEKVFESENGLDIINPEISLEINAPKVKIIASDETAMNFVTYRWNDEEENTVSPSNNEKEIEVELDIKNGENDLTIIAVDKSNNTTSKTQKFNGVTNPEIIIVLSADGSMLDITCKHEKGIKRVEYTLNGVEYAGDFDDKVVQFSQKLDEGYNRIILTAMSVENTEYTFDGETTYYPAGSDNTNTTSSDTNTETEQEKTNNVNSTNE